MQPLAEQFGETWEMVCLDADSVTVPDALPDRLDWCAASVPGTASDALRAAGRWDGVSPLPLNDHDIWYRATVTQSGRYRLNCAGLATYATLWLNGQDILQSESMFVPQARDVTLEPGMVAHLRFRSVTKAMQGKRDRPRWRPRMIAPPQLRQVRTTVLGHMAGWCPTIQTVGPWMPITCVALDEQPRLIACRLHATLQPDGSGRLDASLHLTQPPTQPVSLIIDGGSAVFQPDGDRLTARIDIPQPRLWWPHTHGKPFLYDVAVTLQGIRHDVGTVGFRHIGLDRGADGANFRLSINGEPIFCRGANWVTADIGALGGNAQAVDRSLALAVEAHFNMLRVPGVAAYEGDHFYRQCDRLGILVWQDCAFANFDYPTDDAFMALARDEVTAFLDRTCGSPCLAVLCGGSEIAQQAAMLGAPEPQRAHPLFDQVIPEIVQRRRADIVHAPHSPFGAGLPFLPGQGVSHYYGVGAYQRPLSDARTARVRFATECLAFANPPDDATIDSDIGCRQTHDPRWKQGVARDAGASWDFEDVRDFYLKDRTGLDPARLRYEDPDRYLDLSRAVLADLFETTFDEWRHPGSTCAGALVWLFQDVRPGAGWGVVDCSGAPKSAWHGMRRACQPVRLAMTDEGLNGLALHVVNETARAVEATLHFRCLADGKTVLVEAKRAVCLQARSAETIRTPDLLPAFFDVTYAYRFGPRAHDVCIATLLAPDGTTLSEVFHTFPEPAHPNAPIQWHVETRQEDDGWSLLMRADRFARSVRVQDRSLRAQDSWFHMAPERDYRILLHASGDRRPDGQIVALNCANPVQYRAA